MSINSLRKSLSALKTWHNSLTFSVPDLKSKYLAAIPLFFAELVTETYGMLLSWRTNLMCRRSVYNCFSDSNQNGCHHCHTFTQMKIYILYWFSDKAAKKQLIPGQGRKNSILIKGVNKWSPLKVLILKVGWVGGWVWKIKASLCQNGRKVGRSIL